MEGIKLIWKVIFYMLIVAYCLGAFNIVLWFLLLKYGRKKGKMDLVEKSEEAIKRTVRRYKDLTIEIFDKCSEYILFYMIMRMN